MHTQKHAPNQPVHNDGVQQNDNKTQFIKKWHDILRRLVFDIGQKLYKYINLKGGDQPILWGGQQHIQEYLDVQLHMHGSEA